jgi:chorismate dehydratase
MKVRLGQISYTNVLPVYWGFREKKLPSFLKITEAPPRTLNHLLANDMLDISPVSSISYAKYFNKLVIVPGFSIASRGPVMSVLLLSKAPMKDLTGRRVVMSEESETSVELLQLCLRHEGVFPLIEQGQIRPHVLDDPGISGVLLIGDLALRLANINRVRHKTDLGLFWKEWTGKPFVFAVWAVRRQFAAQEPALVAETIAALSSSRNEGLASLSAISGQTSRQLGISKHVMEAYFRGLSYSLDKEHEEGLRLFFNQAREMGHLEHRVPLEYFAGTQYETI